MGLGQLVYEAAMGTARPLLRLAAPFHSKLRLGVAGWWWAAARIEEWALGGRDVSRPLVWLHAPSVGEALMAQAIVAGVRESRPEAQVAFTHYSPSAERIAARVGADFYGYLPWDSRGEARRAVAALRPDVLAFVRSEVWPALAREAAAAGSKLALVNAVLGATSSRLRPLPRRLLGAAYARLDLVGAVAEEDGQRFERLRVAPERVRVTGDARFDQVWARVDPLRAGERPLPPLVEKLRTPDVFTTVAGSTWPADEARLVPAFARVCIQRRARLIIAPHEPTDAHLRELEHALTEAGLRSVRLAAIETGALAHGPEAVLIDRVGLLADVYAVADLAYVGGGFHTAGLHSVIEPAAFGIPVLFGPRYGNAREAGELAAAGGGIVVRTSVELSGRLLSLASEAHVRQRAGVAALAYVRSRLGGAARNAALILELLEAVRPAMSFGG